MEDLLKRHVVNRMAAETTKGVAKELGLPEAALLGWAIEGLPGSPDLIDRVKITYRSELEGILPAGTYAPTEKSTDTAPAKVGLPKPWNESKRTEFVPVGQGGAIMEGAAPMTDGGGLKAIAHAPAEPEPGQVGGFKVETQESTHAATTLTPTGNLDKAKVTRNICLLFPIYKSVEPGMMMSVLAFWDKTTMRAEFRGQDAMIARSRNHLARRFLEQTDSEWSLWIDDDVIMPCGSAGLFRYLVGGVDPGTKGRNDGHWSYKMNDDVAGLSAPSRLISHGKTIVSGVYFDRLGHDSITAVFGTGPQQKLPADTLLPVDFAGFGCMLVHRSVYLDIAKKFPETYHKDAPGFESGFFTPIQDSETKRMYGEDQAFCHRAKEAGHPTYLDLNLICGHVGSAIHGLPNK